MAQSKKAPSKFSWFINILIDSCRRVFHKKKQGIRV